MRPDGRSNDELRPITIERDFTTTSHGSVLVSFGDAETTQRTIASIQSDGTCWCGGTVWQGQPAMRISVSSWATTDDDVEKSLVAMLRCAAAAKR